MFEPTTLSVMNNLTIADTRATQKLDLVVPCCNPPEDWVMQMATDYRHLQELMPDTEILEYMCTENNRYFRLVPDAAPPGAPVVKPAK